MECDDAAGAGASAPPPLHAPAHPHPHPHAGRAAIAGVGSPPVASSVPPYPNLPLGGPAAQAWTAVSQRPSCPDPAAEFPGGGGGGGIGGGMGAGAGVGRGAGPGMASAGAFPGATSDATSNRADATLAAPRDGGFDSGHHRCSPRCVVQAEFGNLYRCLTGGIVHVCDSNCGLRVWRDRHSSICRVSRRGGWGGGLPVHPSTHPSIGPSIPSIPSHPPPPVFPPLDADRGAPERRASQKRLSVFRDGGEGDGGDDVRGVEMGTEDWAGASPDADIVADQERRRARLGPTPSCGGVR